MTAKIVSLFDNVVPGTNLIVRGTHNFHPGNDQQSISIVLVQDATMHYFKCYIGTDNDINEVVRWGAKVNRKITESIFGEIDNWGGL